MEGKLLRFKVRFNYFDSNPINFSNEIFAGFRLSLWKNEDNFTASEIVEIIDSGSIKPGNIVSLMLKIIDSEVSRQIKVNDKLFCGVNYQRIGEIEVLECLSDEKFFIPT